MRESRSNINSSNRFQSALDKLIKKSGLEEKDFIIPTKILFNGGSCKSDMVQVRILDLFKKWSSRIEPQILSSESMSLAVAHGAHYYSCAKTTGKGVRIRSGVARSYYLGLEGAAPAIPGLKAPIHGLCVVPQGTEEGSSLASIEKKFALKTGKKVQFRFYSSNTRAGDSVGTMVEDANENLKDSGLLEVSLDVEEKTETRVPVQLKTEVSEIGTLNLKMQDISSSRSWSLEYNVRS